MQMEFVFSSLSLDRTPAVKYVWCLLILSIVDCCCLVFFNHDWSRVWLSVSNMFGFQAYLAVGSTIQHNRYRPIPNIVKPLDFFSETTVSLCWDTNPRCFCQSHHIFWPKRNLGFALDLFILGAMYFVLQLIDLSQVLVSQFFFSSIPLVFT
jgi:hypothetical protein